MNKTECTLKLNLQITKKRNFIISELNKIYPMPIQYTPLHQYMNLDSAQFKNSSNLSKQIVNLPVNHIDPETVIKLAKKLDEIL